MDNYLIPHLFWVALLCLLFGFAFAANAQILPQILYAPHHLAACGTVSFVLSSGCNIISLPVAL